MTRRNWTGYVIKKNDTTKKIQLKSLIKAKHYVHKIYRHILSLEDIP